MIEDESLHRQRLGIGRQQNRQMLGIGREQIQILGYAAMAGIVAWWAWRAFQDPHGYDLRLAYKGGQIAWATGHPERQWTWDGTPLLAVTMAIVTRLMSLGAAMDLITTINVVLVTGTIAIVLRKLRPQLTPGWWWLTAFALLSFGPIMSSVWWRQFNIIALVLALAGFELLRRGRSLPAGLLMGLSISIKPLVFLLALVLLTRRQSRPTGALAIASVAVLNIAAQALLATRSSTLAVISPWPAFRNFVDKATPSHVWACQAQNLAPGSLLCRLVGSQHWTLQHIVVWTVVGLLGAGVLAVLRGVKASSWELFAFTCPLSVMLSPLAWTHYQITLAPLFVLLLVRFTQNQTSLWEWVGLVVAFALCSLMWEPYGTSIGALGGLLSLHRETTSDANTIAWVAQFAQYLLVIIGCVWYAGRLRAYIESGAETPSRPSDSAIVRCAATESAIRKLSIGSDSAPTTRQSR